MILLWHQHGPVGKISYLTVDEDSIHFLDKKVSISGIVKIMIKLDDDRVQYSRSRNNLFEIKTTYGQTYKFGILIYDSGDEKQVVGIVELLKSKINDFTYDGYM
jgi:predicted transcriptional regulator